MNTRFFNAKILVPEEGHRFAVTEGELWVQGDTISYIGDKNQVEHALEPKQQFRMSSWEALSGKQGEHKRTEASRGVQSGALQAPEPDQKAGVQPENAGTGEAMRWDREIDACGNLLIPGFANAHTHTAMTFLRSYADDLPLADWLNEQVFPREAKLVAEDAYWLTVLGIMEYLTSGITSDFDMYFFEEMSAKAAADTGFRMVQTGSLNDFTGSLERMEELWHRVNEMSELTSFVVGFHAEYTTSKERMEGVAKLAQKLKSPVWLHNSETRSEVEACKGRWGMTPTALTDALGMYGYGGGGYHCVWFEEADFEIFRERGLTAVTNPASNLKLASGICPVKQFVELGIPVAIGTDGPASNNCLDMFREMFLTAALAKVRESDAACIGAEEIFYMATAGGAHAMRLFDCGSLAVGKKADLVMIDLQQPNMQPENHLVKNLVYSGSKQNVKLTMVNGRILYEDGQFAIGFDPKEVYAKANAVIGRMR